MRDLVEWNTANIYKAPKLETALKVMEGCLKQLVSHFMEALTKTRDPKQLRDRGLDEHRDCYRVLAEFIERVKYDDDVPEAQISIDFVAGMTDNFASRTFTDLFVPTPIV